VDFNNASCHKPLLQLRFFIQIYVITVPRLLYFVLYTARATRPLLLQSIKKEGNCLAHFILCWIPMTSNFLAILYS
jgi:hypothetical protein